jgi:hypothetical protein
MTTDRPDPSSDSLRDPRFDAAWREASREAPPAALDAAILAAARRAVGAGPQPVAVREATRPERWWWPLAAAASIGAVAVGILQVSGLDQARAPDPKRAIVSDMPAEPPPAAQGSQDKAAGRDGRMDFYGIMPSLPNDAVRRAPAPPVSAMAENAAPTSPDPAPANVMAKLVADPSAAEAAPATEATRAGGQRNPPTAPPATTPALAAIAPRAGSGISASPDSVQPFPADATPAGAAERDGARAKALGKVMSAPGAAARAEAQAKERAPLPVAEWIVLIRKLRAEGRTEALAREVAAFRAAYPDQEHLLVDLPSGGEPPPPPAR